MSRVSGVTDFLVFSTAESERQVLAVKEHIDKILTEKGYRLYGLEGTETGRWVLMDFSDVVVHIFKRGVREQYGLDRLWSDAKRVPLSTARAVAQTAGNSRRQAGKPRVLRQQG